MIITGVLPPAPSSINRICLFSLSERNCLYLSAAAYQPSSCTKVSSLLRFMVIGRPHLGQRGNKLRGYLHILLKHRHTVHLGFIIICGLMAGLAALPEAIVSLSIKQALLIKACQLKLIIHIGGQHKVVFILHKRQQVMVGGTGGSHVSIAVKMSAPLGPVFLLGVKGIKAP